MLKTRITKVKTEIRKLQKPHFILNTRQKLVAHGLEKGDEQSLKPHTNPVP